MCELAEARSEVSDCPSSGHMRGRRFSGRRVSPDIAGCAVNSINLFAKCHHGWADYNTSVAHRHPHLQIDLLGEQIQALRPAGIAVNYYYSLVWDNRSAHAIRSGDRDRAGNGLQTGY
jgi:hypothetical protein